MVVKLGSLNLCLGLQNKKDIVKQIIKSEKIDIMCLQETELITNLDHNLLSFPGFNFESEKCTSKSRVGIYVNNAIDYVRRSDLERVDCHVIIIDVGPNPCLRVINMYRSFNPPNNQDARTFFFNQLQLIKHAITRNTLVMGDFNLDLAKRGLSSYAFNAYFNELDQVFEDLNVEQLVDFPTWSRTVAGRLRESSIDHVYATNTSLLSNLCSFKPCFGDHVAITLEFCSEKEPNKIVYRRCWKKYNKESLLAILSTVDWSSTDDTVQGFWNSFENKLINVVDSIIPMCHVNNNVNSERCPPRINNLLNVRKRLIKRLKNDKTADLRDRVRSIDKEIKRHFTAKKSEQIRRTIKPNNCQSLWKAVKIARDVNIDALPKSMCEKSIPIENDHLPDRFALFFHTKIVNLLEDVSIDENVYNGVRKVTSSNSNFMDLESVINVMKGLKAKNSEGYDRIPQRILVDGVDVLCKPIQKLMDLIYTEVKVPDQWLISKTIPVFKNKGQKKDIENYRPIANLCSTSKIFEKLILKRILQIEDSNNVDLTGAKQHGFKRKHSTSTLSAELLSQISRALDDEEYVIMASLDLSSAFDLVNIDLLIKRLKKVGLPSDIVNLISCWLRNRSFYVNIDGENSILYDLLLGTVQGSILGPVLYAIFVSPMFDLADLSAFADDTFIPMSNSSITKLITDMEKSIEAITKWLKQSGLIVNQEKTEACLFYKNDCAQVNLKVGENRILTKKSMNVLGVIFDCKLQWSDHVAGALTKSNRSLNAIKIIRKHFSTKELTTLVTSNYFSILFYNSEIWHSSNLKVNLHQNLLSASANALKMCLHYPKLNVSNVNLHKITNRATPSMYNEYKCALQLFKLFNDNTPQIEWLHLNFNIVNTPRQHFFEIYQTNQLRIGKNALCNKLHQLNGKIPLAWLNLSFDSFKIKCKNKFLTF